MVGISVVVENLEGSIPNSFGRHVFDRTDLRLSRYRVILPTKCGNTKPYRTMFVLFSIGLFFTGKGQTIEM